MDIPEIGFIWAKGLYLFVGQPAAKTNQNKVELLKKKVGKTTKYLKAIAGGGQTKKPAKTQFYKQLKLELKLKCLQSLLAVAKTPKKIPLVLRILKLD